MADGQTVIADIKLNQLYIGEGWYHRRHHLRALSTRSRAEERSFSCAAAMFAWSFLDCRLIEAASGTIGRATRSPVDQSIDVDHLLRRVGLIEQGLKATAGWLRTYPNRVLHVEYEDLFDAETLASNQQAFDKKAAFAGLPRAAIAITFVKDRNKAAQLTTIILMSCAKGFWRASTPECLTGHGSRRLGLQSPQGKSRVRPIDA